MAANEENIIALLIFLNPSMGRYKSTSHKDSSMFLMISQSDSNLPKTIDDTTRNTANNNSAIAGFVMSFLKSDTLITNGNKIASRSNKTFGRARI
jgi:hypothetical protein